MPVQATDVTVLERGWQVMVNDVLILTVTAVDNAGQTSYRLEMSAVADDAFKGFNVTPNRKTWTAADKATALTLARDVAANLWNQYEALNSARQALGRL